MTFMERILENHHDEFLTWVQSASEDGVVIPLAYMVSGFRDKSEAGCFAQFVTGDNHYRLESFVGQCRPSESGGLTVGLWGGTFWVPRMEDLESLYQENPETHFMFLVVGEAEDLIIADMQKMQIQHIEVNGGVS